MRQWVEKLCNNGDIVKIRNTGMGIRREVVHPYMAEIHGTLGCLATNGGKDVKDLENCIQRGWAQVQGL